MRKMVLAVMAAGGLWACEPRKESAAPAEWVPIASTSEGGQVLFKPGSIAHDAQAGTADIQVKITYPNLESWTVELPDYVEQKMLNAERVTLRFDCAAKRFAIVRREALDAGGDVKETVTPPVGGKETFKPIAPGGLAALAVERACGA